MNKEIDDKTTLKASTIEQDDDKEHSESLVTQSIDPSNAAARFTQEDSNLDRGHEARQQQEAGSIMIGRTIPITTTIEKSPRTSISTTSNFATTSSSTTTNPSASASLPGSNKGKGDSTSSSLEDDPHTTRRGPPEDVFVVDDADKGDEHDHSHSKDYEAAIKSQDLLIDEEEQEKDRKRIERNKRERMLSKQRAQLKADKNKLMTNQIQKLQQENEELRQKIEGLFDELSVLIPPDQVEIVRQRLSMYGTM